MHRLLILLFIVTVVGLFQGCSSEPKLEQTSQFPTELPYHPSQFVPLFNKKIPSSLPDPTILVDETQGKVLETESILRRGEVYLDEIQLLPQERFLPRLILHVEGTLPTPCHLLEVEISSPDQLNRINIELYSSVDPGIFCIQVLEPFEKNIPLSITPGEEYSIWVNGKPVGENSL